MNKLGVLVKVQLLNVFGINKAIHSKDKKEKKKLIGFTILMVFVSVMILFSLAIYNILFADVFEQVGALELLPALMMSISSVMTLFTTIYKANGLLFNIKDYDMTMALPVQTKAVVASRLMLLYLMNLGFSILVMVPCGIVYAMRAAPSAWFFPTLIFLLIFIPMVPMIIGTAIGSLLSAIASRFRHTNLINLILTMLLAVTIILLSFNMGSFIENAAEITTMLMNTIYGIYPLTEMYTQALCYGNIISLLLFVFISLALFAGFSIVLGHYYKKLNTALMTSRTLSNYKMTELKVSSPIIALYKRELHRYFSSSPYVLNTAIGMILAVVMSICLLIFNPDDLEKMLEISGFSGIITNLAPLALAVFVGMTCTTCSSISLEGNNLWVLKSLPVKADSIFLSKILVNLTVTIPLSLICAIIMAIALPINAVQMLLLVFTPIAYAVFIAQAGLYINLMFPNFTWTSEITVIKQSAAMALSLLTGFVVSIVPIVVLMTLPESDRLPGLGITTVVVAIIDVVLFQLLHTKGVRKFEAL